MAGFMAPGCKATATATANAQYEQSSGVHEGAREYGRCADCNHLRFSTEAMGRAFNNG